MKHLNCIFIAILALFIFISCSTTDIKNINKDNEIILEKENENREPETEVPYLQTIQDIADIKDGEADGFNNGNVNDLSKDEIKNSNKTTFEYIPVEKIIKDAEEQKVKESQKEPLAVIEEDKTLIAKSTGAPVSYTYDMLAEYNSFLEAEGYKDASVNDDIEPTNSPSISTPIPTEPFIIESEVDIPSYTVGTTAGVLKPVTEEIATAEIQEEKNEINTFEEVKDILDNDEIDNTKEAKDNNFVIYLITFVICSIVTVLSFLIVMKIKKRR